MDKVKVASISKEARHLSKSLARADKRLTAYLLKYSPDQPRDEKGRFASTGGVRGGGSSRFLTPANSPSWWPSMSRDLLVLGAIGTAVGIVPIVQVAGRSFNRSILRGMGMTAARMAERLGGHVSGHFQTLARAAGFKIPRGALKGVPRRYSRAAWNKLPKDIKDTVDRTVNRVVANTRRVNAGGKMRVVTPKAPKK